MCKVLLLPPYVATKRRSHQGTLREGKEQEMQAEIKHIDGAYKSDSNIVVDVCVKDIPIPVYAVRILLETHDKNQQKRKPVVANIESDWFPRTENKNGYIYLEREEGDTVIYPEFSVQIELVSKSIISDFSDLYIIDLSEIVLEGPGVSPHICLSPNMSLCYSSPLRPLKDQMG